MPLPPLRQYCSPVLRKCVRYLEDLSTLRFCSPQDKRSQRIRLTKNTSFNFTTVLTTLTDSSRLC